MKLVVLALMLIGMAVQDPHEGQPAYCINHDGHPKYPNKAPHTCACDKPCKEGDPEDRMCSVYCRRNDCHCVKDC